MTSAHSSCLTHFILCVNDLQEEVDDAGLSLKDVDEAGECKLRQLKMSYDNTSPTKEFQTQSSLIFMTRSHRFVIALSIKPTVLLLNTNKQSYAYLESSRMSCVVRLVGIFYIKTKRG